MFSALRKSAFAVICTGILLGSAPLAPAQVTEREQLDMGRILEQSCNLSPAQREYLGRFDQLYVAIDNSWPPYEYVDENGNYRGLAADYMRILEACTGVRFQIEKDRAWTHANQVRDAMRAGEIDLFSCVADTPLRRKFMSPTRPYLDFPNVIVTRDDAPMVRDIRELRGKLIAVGAGYATDEYLRANHPELSVQSVGGHPRVARALEMVFRGEAHAYVGNVASVSYFMNQGDFEQLRIAGEIPYRFQMGVSVRNDLPELREIFDQILAAVPPDVEDQIYSRWIDLRVATPGLDWNRVWQVGGILLALAALALSWNFMLQREIRRRRTAESRLQELNRKLSHRVEREMALRRASDELRHNQEQLSIQQAKMAAMGEMIGAIAHQWRQPLSGLSLGLQELDDWEQLDAEERSQLCAQLERSVQFLITTMETLGDFFRPYQPPSDFDPIEAIADTLSLLAPILRHNDIQVGTTASPSARQALIRGSRNRFQQVVLNLINNAREAIAQQDTQESRRIDIRLETSGTSLIIRIADTGGGIPPEIIERLFERFATSKRDSGGTGIGLPLARRIIEEMGGGIEARNRAEGAEFLINLPRVDKPPD